MAIGFVDIKAHKTAKGYYDTFKSEPTGSGTDLAIDAVHEVSNMSLDAFLDQLLLKAASGGDVLLVSHGTNNGISMPLATGSAYKLSDYGAMESLIADPLAEAAKCLKLSESQVSSLRDKIEKVKKLDLKHLALRACKIGTYETTMAKIKKFFDVESVSAPMKRDAFARFDPGKFATAQSQWDDWQRKYPEWPIFGTTPNRFAIRTEGGDDGTHTFTPYVLAESASAITQWVHSHIPASDTFEYSKGSVYMHAMWATPLIFPKDGDYTTNMRFFIKAEEF